MNLDNMSDRAALERSLQRSRADLRQAVGQLGVRARDQIDIAERIRERPVHWVAAAFAVGFLLGLRS